MNFDIVFVLLALIGMIAALVWDKMRPGMVLLTVVVFFLCVGILTPKEMLEGFSNKGMITVAMLFLVSEGVRQSGALGQLIKKLLPEGKTTVFKAQARMLPPVAFVSAFLNNTPVVVIFAPIIKRWAEAVRLPATKFLIPLSYVTILGGICTLIGTSTNLVVHGMILEAGYEGFTMFELGKVGILSLSPVFYICSLSRINCFRTRGRIRYPKTGRMRIPGISTGWRPCWAHASRVSTRPWESLTLPAITGRS